MVHDAVMSVAVWGKAGPDACCLAAEFPCAVEQLGLAVCVLLVGLGSVWGVHDSEVGLWGGLSHNGHHAAAGLGHPGASGVAGAPLHAHPSCPVPGTGACMRPSASAVSSCPAGTCCWGTAALQHAVCFFPSSVASAGVAPYQTDKDRAPVSGLRLPVAVVQCEADGCL